MKIIRKTLTLAILLPLLGQLGGCGQKGPLVLPDPAPANKPATN